MQPLSDPITLADYEALARARLAPEHVAFFWGGAGDEKTLGRNEAAFDRLQLLPRMLVDVSGCTAATSVLGHELSFPVVVAPMSRMRIAHPDGEAGIGRAALAAGTVMCLAFASTSPLEAVAETGAQRWQNIPNFRDRGLATEFIRRVEEQGFTALVFTVDAPLPGNRDRARRMPVAVPPDMRAAAFGRELETSELEALFRQDCSWDDLEWMAAEARIPVVAKGVLVGADGALAVEHGAAAVAVSNHGGRQLDRVPATIEALPEVVESVAGRVEVLVDGGIRRGIDVVTALALGARAVLIGRPVMWGLAAEGETGVRRVLELLRAETELSLKLLGAASPEAVTREHVREVTW